MPIEVQRKRTKGFKLPPNTICVDRTSKWGNPFKLDKAGRILYRTIDNTWEYWNIVGVFTTQEIVDLYEGWMNGHLNIFTRLPKPPSIEELRDKNLACFCSLGTPCHRTPLMKLANK